MVKPIKIDEQTWRFEEEGVRFFLLTGKTRALLVDSGMQTNNAREVAREYTDLPLSLLNTHADPDHICSNKEFDAFYMHPAECVNYYGKQKRSGCILPVWDGDVLDLGDRTLRIIALPGHTPGSIAVLDERNRRLFSGDPVQDGRIFMFGACREMHAYVHSLYRLEKMTGLFDDIYPSHGSCPVSPALIPQLAAAAEQILAGQAQGAPAEVFGQPISAYDMGMAVFLCDRDASWEIRKE